MLNNYNAVMTSEQSIKLEGLRVTLNKEETNMTAPWGAIPMYEFLYCVNISENVRPKKTAAAF